MVRMESVIENVTITKKNGVKQLHDAILFTRKGIYTGSINIVDNNKLNFEEHGFIPRDQIKKITVIDDQGKPQDIDL